MKSGRNQVQRSGFAVIRQNAAHLSQFINIKTTMNVLDWSSGQSLEAPHGESSDTSWKLE